METFNDRGVIALIMTFLGGLLWTVSCWLTIVLLTVALLLIVPGIGDE